MCADKSSGLYEVINEATKNTPLQYSIPARIPTAAQTELKIEVPTESRLRSKETVTYEEIDGSDTSFNNYLNFEEVKQELKKELKKKRNKKSIPLYFVKFAVITAFVFVMIVAVSVVIALFLHIRSLHGMNRELQKSLQKLRSVYCEINGTLGGNSTGWMRVAELDVNNCPSGLRHEITNDSVNTCVVIEDNAGCTEIIYPMYNIRYTQITGQVRGYQVESLDGFVSHNTRIPRPTNFTDLNNNYLDGVSISTNGQHVWSFAAGCNCLNTNNKPTIIGRDYTCDGIEGRPYIDLLWASQQCGTYSTWFHKAVSPTTTDIKVRICRDENRENEDLALKTLELYVH